MTAEEQFRALLASRRDEAGNLIMLGTGQQHGRRTRRGHGGLLPDRLAITGARWSLPGAAAILLLHAAITKGDFDRAHVEILCLDPVEVRRITEAAGHPTPA